jgi:hypothetical protein
VHSSRGVEVKKLQKGVVAGEDVPLACLPYCNVNHIATPDNCSAWLKFDNTAVRSPALGASKQSRLAANSQDSTSFLTARLLSWLPWQGWPRLSLILKFPRPESSPQSAVDPFLLLIGKFIAARSANPNERPNLASSKWLNLSETGAVIDRSHSQDQAQGPQATPFLPVPQIQRRTTRGRVTALNSDSLVHIRAHIGASRLVHSMTTWPGACTLHCRHHKYRAEPSIDVSLPCDSSIETSLIPGGNPHRPRREHR